MKPHDLPVNAVLINESAVKFLGVKDPLGVRLTTPNRQGGQDVHEIIGVFQDVYYKSFHEKIEPMMMSLNTDKNNALSHIPFVILHRTDHCHFRGGISIPQSGPR